MNRGQRTTQGGGGFDAAWLMYLCAMHGHIIQWTAASTGQSQRAGICQRCGAFIRG